MIKQDLKVGMTVYCLPYGNNCRYWDGEIRDAVISKIGSQYFYASFGGISPEKFAIENGRSIGFNAGWIAYISKQSIEDEKEQEKTNDWLRPFFAWGKPKLSLEKLRQIKKIVTNEP